MTLTLKAAIQAILAQARRTTLRDGSTQYTYAGNVHWEVREAVWAAYRRGELDPEAGSLVAEKAGCRVNFRFGIGHSTQNWVRFVYTDSRV